MVTQRPESGLLGVASAALSLSVSATPPPHGGDPKLALMDGAFRDASTGVDIQDRGRGLHRHGIPVEVSRPTAADGFEEASVARDGYHLLPPLPCHPLLMWGQMASARAGSGQSAAFCLPVVNGLVASAPTGGRAGGGSPSRSPHPLFDLLFLLSLPFPNARHFLPHAGRRPATRW